MPYAGPDLHIGERSEEESVPDELPEFVTIGYLEEADDKVCDACGVVGIAAWSAQHDAWFCPDDWERNVGGTDGALRRS